MKNITSLSSIGWLVYVCVVVGIVLAASTTTNTQLGITPGILTFYKDTGGLMNSYFGGVTGNTAADINIGTYPASISAITAASSGNHRFTVSDLLGSNFTVTVQSSALTSASGTIAASNIGYTGTARVGTGYALTAAPTGAVDIGTAPVTFVARANASGLSLYSQQITIIVNVPPAQSPGTYTGVLTFTY